MDEVVKEFLVESHENLDQLDRDLVALEKDPGARETLASVFRTIHTIKGTCGFLGFGRLESVAHVGENLLSKLRDGELRLDAEITTALLSMVDAVRQMLAHIEADGTDGDADWSALIETLGRCARTAAPAIAATPEGVQSSAAAAEVERVWSEILASVGTGTGTDAIASPESPPAPAEPAAAASDSAAGGHGVSDTSIRVDVGLLDKLMNLVGELVLARNQILQFTATQADTAFLATSQRLNLITTELQEGVMKTRMQPIGNIWGKFPRVVRDLAVACGKDVRIEMEGRETELDKTIIEAIKDPLTHIVRNAVDHGIEAPGERVAAGKPQTGRLFLRAFHEGGQVNIEISDDGKGLDHDRVREKAVQRGLVTAEQAARMSDREATNLIFLPGFSTAAKITNVSGRGVGMDVVKTNIEKIGGTVDVSSRSGHGTTLRIKIPLTLAIIPALIVTSGGERYAIPQVSLLELVRLEGEQAQKGIEYIHGAPVHRLRGRLLPLVHLGRELGVASDATADDEATNIVVLQADDRQFGLVVDAINDTEEIVVKPLGKQLKGITTFAGATIMGDGRVALILDVLGIAQRANVVSEVRDRALGESERASEGDAAGERETLLLLGIGDDGRVAIPLSLVARLEEFAATHVERAGCDEVVQYRNQIMRLVRVADVLGMPGAAQAPDGPLQVVVYSEEGRSVGLVVDRILDIVEETISVRRATSRRGLCGSAVVQHRVTDVLDVPGIVRGADPVSASA
ncbi:MAG: chemotaxis protein CheA [bacterium]|nr:chemotaxis protein CheA [bacterium]